MKNNNLGEEKMKVRLRLREGGAWGGLTQKKSSSTNAKTLYLTVTWGKRDHEEEGDDMKLLQQPRQGLGPLNPLSQKLELILRQENKNIYIGTCPARRQNGENP